MDLRQLECFLAVCEELHFSRAAEKLHMSQPSLSRHIRNLEAAVGTPLFDRIGRGTALTEAGRLLLVHAQRIFHEMEQARAAIRDLSGLQRGKLAIGSLLTVSYLLPPAVSKFKQLYPNIELSVFGLRARDVANKLLENELDLGITLLPPGNDDLEGIPLVVEELALAVPVGHRLTSLREVPMATLADVETILLPETYHLRTLVDECCSKVGVTLKPTLEMSSLDALMHMVADGAGVTVLPGPYIEALRNPRVAKVKLVEPTPLRSIGLVYRKGKFMCATTRTFIEQLTNIAAGSLDAAGGDPDVAAGGSEAAAGGPDAAAGGPDVAAGGPDADRGFGTGAGVGVGVRTVVRGAGTGAGVRGAGDSEPSVHPSSEDGGRDEPLEIAALEKRRLAKSEPPRTAKEAL